MGCGFAFFDIGEESPDEECDFKGNEGDVFWGEPDKGVEFFLELFDESSGKGKTNDFLFHGKFIEKGDVLYVFVRGLVEIVMFGHVKEGAKPFHLVLVFCFMGFDVPVKKREIARFFFEALFAKEGIKRSCFEENFYNRTTEFVVSVHAFDEIFKTGKGAVCFSFFNDGVGETFPHAFECPETKADCPLGGRESLFAEIREAFVDVGGEDGNSRLSALFAIGFYIVGFILVAGEEACHKLGSVVGLEVGNLVGKNGIGCGVRLVEGIG